MAIKTAMDEQTQQFPIGAIVLIGLFEKLSHTNIF